MLPLDPWYAHLSACRQDAAVLSTGHAFEWTNTKTRFLHHMFAKPSRFLLRHAFVLAHRFWRCIHRLPAIRNKVHHAAQHSPLCVQCVLMYKRERGLVRQGCEEHRGHSCRKCTFNCTISALVRTIDPCYRAPGLRRVEGDYFWPMQLTAGLSNSVLGNEE